MSKEFKFELNENVKIDASGESGIVIGRADYLSGDDMYNLRYKAADGRAVENWWSVLALSLVK